MKQSNLLYTLVITFLLITSLPSYAQEQSSDYSQSVLLNQNVYDHFLKGNMKPNLLETATKARKEIEIYNLRFGDSITANFLSDATVIELSYMLYWFSFNKEAIVDGVQPYWVNEEDLKISHITQLADNLNLNHEPGIITVGLDEITEKISTDENYLKSGRAENDIRILLKEKLWCGKDKRDVDSSKLHLAIKQMRERNINSVIEEYASQCE